MHAAAAAVTALSIVVSPGDGGAGKRWTLECGPTGGSLPKAAAACRKLAQLGAWYAPIPEGTACTQVFGGPETARVTGRYRGRRLWIAFQRRNGCEIARWTRVAFLFPRA
jgi:Subtilisin inhibitor-like